jgi:DNA-binding YbaB/EbfC family protein
MSDVDDDDDEGGGFDLGELLKQAQAMQEQVMAAQATAAEQIVEGSAGGGLVRVTVTGGMDFRAIHIDPSAVDPADVEMLQDLVVAAINDALAGSRRMAEEKLAAVTGGLRLPGL